MTSHSDFRGDSPPFESLVALRERHEQLLSQFEDPHLRLSEQSSLELRLFVQRVVNTGPLISTRTNRRLAQNILDYWSSLLLRQGDDVALDRPRLLDYVEGSGLLSEQEVSCPYVGLAPFDRSTQREFFGRTEIISKLVSAIHDGKNVLLAGQSGSGKSSVMRAGIAANSALAEWRVIGPYEPGHQLSATIAVIQEALGRSATAGNPARTILLLDQFEEIFTICDALAEREAFGRQLKAIVAHHRLQVVVGIRSDYLDAVLRLPEYTWLGAAQLETVAYLDPAALRLAILEPAKRVNLEVDDEVWKDLVAKTVNEGSGLPLLQFALVELWRQRERDSWVADGQGRLSYQVYTRLGGSPSAILNNAANREYEALTTAEQAFAAKHLFLELVQLSDTLEITSRPQPMSELQQLEEPGRVRAVVDKLLAAGLLRRRSPDIVGEAWIAVAHEALIRNWGLLRRWINEDRSGVVLRLQLRKKVRVWLNAGKARTEWLTAKEIAQFAELEGLRRDEKELLRVSRDAVRLRSIVRRSLFTCLSLALIALVVGAGYIYRSRLIVAQKDSQNRLLQLEVESRDQLLSGGRPVMQIANGKLPPLSNDFWERKIAAKRTSIHQLLNGTGIAKTILMCGQSPSTQGVGVLVEFDGKPWLLTARRNLANSGCLGKFGERPRIRLAVEFVRPNDEVVRFYINTVARVNLRSAKEEKYLKRFTESIAILELPTKDGAGEVRTRGVNSTPRIIKNRRASASDIKAFKLTTDKGAAIDSKGRQLVLMAGFVSFERGNNVELAAKARALFSPPMEADGKEPPVPNYVADQFWVRLGTIVGVSPDDTGYFVHDCITTESDYGAPLFDVDTGRLLGITIRGTPVLGDVPVHQPAVALWQLRDLWSRLMVVP